MFSGYHYRVTLVVSDSADSVRQGGDRGSLTIQLHGDIQSSPMSQLNDESVVISSVKSLTLLQNHTVKCYHLSNDISPFKNWLQLHFD